MSHTWAIVAVIWSIVRAGIVWAALSDYSINPWVYLAIDLASALVDGYTTPKAVLAFIDERYHEAAKWVVISAVAFIVPDLYLVLGGKRLPVAAFIIIGVVLTITTTVSIIGIRKKIRQGKAVRSTVADAAPDTISR